MIDVHKVAAWVNARPEFLYQLADMVQDGSAVRHTVRRTKSKKRLITCVDYEYDGILKNLARRIETECNFHPSDHVHGFVKGRSSVTNALPHLGAKGILRVDLKDFFESVNDILVKAELLALGFDEDAAQLVTRICTVGGHLAVGFSTSPILSNIAFQQTDKALKQFVSSKNATLTRFVDDITVSGNEISDDTFQSVEQILVSQGWTINDSKTRFMRSGKKQYVTGLYVGNIAKPSIPRNYKRQLRWRVHLIETVGYARYLKEYGGLDRRESPNRLFGKANYVRSIDPEFGKKIVSRLSELEDLNLNIYNRVFEAARDRSINEAPSLFSYPKYLEFSERKHFG